VKGTEILVSVLSMPSLSEQPSFAMQQEPTWISGIREGNQQAFKAAYDHFADKIFFLSRRFHLSEEESREMVQHVFMVLWSRREKLKDGLSLNAFLLTIAKNKIINLHKHKAVEAASVNAFFRQRQSYSHEDENNVVFHDLEQHTLRFIDTLPARNKEIFMMSRKEGINNENIALRLNISRRTVENNIYQAEIAIRRFLKESKMLERSLSLFILWLFF